MTDRYMEDNRFLDASLMQIRQAPRQFATVEYVEALGDEVMRQDAELERLRAYVGTNYLRSDYKSADHMREEIERLHAELADEQTLRKEHQEQAARNVAKLRDDLAAAKALLREAFAQRHRMLSDWPGDLQQRIRAALGEDNEPVHKELAED